MRKYIVWSENPRLENIQVICLDKKKHLRQHSKPHLPEKKIDTNCHKTEIHYQKKILNDSFSFFESSGRLFRFQKLSFF